MWRLPGADPPAALPRGAEHPSCPCPPPPAPPRTLWTGQQVPVPFSRVHPLQKHGPAASRGWDGGGACRDAASDPMAFAGPHCPEVRVEMEERGSRQLPLCSRFASTRQLPGNSIHAAARERQNMSPHPRLHGPVGMAQHSVARLVPPLFLQPPAFRSPTAHPTPPKNPTLLSSSIPFPHGIWTRVLGPGCQVVLLARFSHAERGFS